MAGRHRLISILFTAGYKISITGRSSDLFRFSKPSRSVWFKQWYSIENNRPEYSGRKLQQRELLPTLRPGESRHSLLIPVCFANVETNESTNIRISGTVEKEKYQKLKMKNAGKIFTYHTLYPL